MGHSCSDQLVEVNKRDSEQLFCLIVEFENDNEQLFRRVSSSQK